MVWKRVGSGLVSLYVCLGDGGASLLTCARVINEVTESKCIFVLSFFD